MVGLGILFAPVDIWIKAYFAHGRGAAGAVLHHHDQDAARRARGLKLVNRIEDARAERLLMGIERGKE